MTDTNPNSDFPGLVQIDRNMAIAFGTLVLSLMLFIASLVTYFHAQIAQDNERQLRTVITDLLAHSINRISFSGTYHARMLVEQLVQSQPRLSYIIIADPQGNIIAHSDSSQVGAALEPDLIETAQDVFESSETVFTDRTVENKAIQQVSMPYRVGYEDAIGGVIHVGMSADDLRTSHDQSRLILLTVMVGLSLLTMLITFAMSRRFAGPVKKMALQFKKVLDHAPLLIRIVDPEGRNHAMSSTFAKLPPRDRGVFDAQWQQALDQKCTVQQELSQDMENGQHHYIATSFPIETAGQEEQACFIALDITEKKRSADELRKFKTVADRASYGVAICDPAGTILYCNSAFAEMHGHEQATLLGTSLTDLMENQEDCWSRFTDMEHAVTVFEVSHRRADGSTFPALINSSRITDDKGRIEFLSLTAVDITSQKLAEQDKADLEERLQQSQKMESIGQLAGGVAHDFNNLLTAIIGNAEMINLYLDENSEESSYAEDIIKASTRAAELVRQLLTFSRKGQMQTEDLDLHDVIADVCKLVARSIDRRIEIIRELDPLPIYLHGDSGQLQNALLNLAVNARDAMPDGGTLTFQTRRMSISHYDVPSCWHDVPPGNYVECVVSDTGIGMDEYTKSKAFEPFFTTKGVGEGTGLGLASAYGCIKSHKGFIQIESEKGEGCAFRILLPLTASDVRTQDDNETTLVRGQGHLFVVDDEPFVREYAQRILTTLGYRVTIAEDGLTAVEIFKHISDSVDLILLDLIMPKLGGSDTFRQLRAIDPNANVVICSGFSPDNEVEELMREGALGFLQKPFRMEDLSEHIFNYLQEANNTVNS